MKGGRGEGRREGWKERRKHGWREGRDPLVCLGAVLRQVGRERDWERREGRKEGSERKKLACPWRNFTPLQRKLYRSSVLARSMSLVQKNTFLEQTKSSLT